jgi:hypothetical protein
MTEPLSRKKINAIQRHQLFCKAWIEYCILKEAESRGLNIEPRIVFYVERDQQIFNNIVDRLSIDKLKEYELGSEKEKDGEGVFDRGACIFAFVLFDTELSLSRIGPILEAEAKMPRCLKKHKDPRDLSDGFVYRAKMPECFYPTTCLKCGKPLQGGKSDRKTCSDTCKKAWSRIVEQFSKIAEWKKNKNIISTEGSGILLNAYIHLVSNPNYDAFQYRDPGEVSKIEKLISEGRTSFYRDSIDYAIDELGNRVNAPLISYS